MSIPILNEQQIIQSLNSQKNPFFEEYYAFYSSWFGGITQNPKFMLLPIDDHMVHRGDGVFEAMKAENRAVYLMDEHLHRLLRSAEAIALKPLYHQDKMKQIILETLKVANQDNALIRIFVSRGPGNFSVNPYDSVGSQFYVVIAKLRTLPAEKYETGVAVGKSLVPMKPTHLAQVKSCNYLPNVLMKKEAVDRGLDFMIGIDHQGNLTEGPTENVMIVAQDGTLVHPQFDSILKGITMIRVFELAKEHGMKTEVRDISVEELLTAREIIITGTTVDVISVVKYENKTIGNGKPGTISKQLLQLLQNDIKNSPRSSTY